MYPPLNLWCFPSKIHSLFVSGYVTSISNSYLVTCRNVDLDFLPLFPCHQEQLPILGAVIGCSRGRRGLCCTALCRWVSPLRSGTSWRFDVQRSLVSGLSLFPDVRLVSWRKIIMAAMFTCCLGCCGDGGSGHIPLKEMPTVQLDTHHMGKWSLRVILAAHVRAVYVYTRPAASLSVYVCMCVCGKVVCYFRCYF